MKIYLAPMEGITGEVYRRAYHTFFEPMDKYFTPFLNPNPKGKFSRQEWNEILPENNEGMYTVPQILTNRAEDFIRLARQLKEFGYEEVNLNLGCPSKTVVNRKRGSGFLFYPDELNHFLAEVHPRVQQDYYKNKPDWTTFAYACRNSKNPLVYNGDIFCAENYQIFHQKFPETECIMLGRGILMNPFLPAVIKGKSTFDTKKIATFCDHLLDAYIEKSPEEKNAVVKMKELWWYLGKNFKNSEEYLTQIRKSQTIREYRMAVECLLKECPYE